EAMKQRPPPRRKRFPQPPKRLPPASPLPPGTRAAREGLDQTAQQVRAAHEQRARRSFNAISSGSISENPLLPAAAAPASGAGKEQPDQAQFKGEVPSGGSVRTNRVAIVLSVASLMVLIDERLAQLRDERPNAKEAQAVRDEAIARYESIRRTAEA